MKALRKNCIDCKREYEPHERVFVVLSEGKMASKCEGCFNKKNLPAKVSKKPTKKP